MFGLVSNSCRSRKSIARSNTTLCLERLEDRLSPSGGPGGLTLTVTYLQGQEATFSGQLKNQNGPIANETINLTGAVKASTTTNAQGNYSITVSVPQLGNEYAVSADGLYNGECGLAGGAPVIGNFTAVDEGNGLWLFSGIVSGAPAQGEVVNFGGINALNGESTSVNSDGSFDFYAMVPSGQGGSATAQAVDWWGDTSSVATTNVNA